MRDRPAFACGVVRHFREAGLPVGRARRRSSPFSAFDTVRSVGQPVETGESEKQRISLQDLQVTQARPAEQQHPHQGQRDPKRPVVTIELADREHLLEPFGKARPIEESAKQLDSAMRAEFLFGENDRKIGLDTTANRPFLSSHDCGSFGVGMFGSLFLPTTDGATFNSGDFTPKKYFESGLTGLLFAYQRSVISEYRRCYRRD